MRSTLSHAGTAAVAPRAPAVTAPANTGAQAAPRPPVQAPPGPEITPQVALYQTTEALALALVKQAQTDLLNQKPGPGAATVKELRDATVFAMDLLAKLPKLKPKELEREDEGVELLREAMSNPAKVVDRLQANPAFIERLMALGWLPPKPQVSHRPTKEQQKARADYDQRQKELEAQTAPEDAELQNMLRRVAG